METDKFLDEDYPTGEFDINALNDIVKYMHATPKASDHANMVILDGRYYNFINDGCRWIWFEYIDDEFIEVDSPLK